MSLLPLSTGVLDADLGTSRTNMEARYRKVWRSIPRILWQAQYMDRFCKSNV